MTIKAVLKLEDVKTLAAGFFPVLYGSVYSLSTYRKFNSGYMIALTVAIALIQASTNMFNDYMDYRRGTDGNDKAEEKVLVSGELSPKQILALIFVFLSVALVIGVAIARETSWIILLIGLAGAAVAFTYSSGPKPISYTPFGEAAAGITMGFGITSTVVFIQAGYFYWQGILMALPSVIYIAYIMFTNNLCDLEKDKAAGRRTLPGLLGFQTAKRIWLLCCPLLISLTVLFIFIGAFPLWNLITLLLLVNYRSLADIRRLEQAQFHKGRMMGFIGKIGAQYHLLMIFGLILAYIAAQ